ncbi:hypothetical protein EW026_g246 [Hermanssonia centrifuga]|uniref:Uncharacterized protein n=1 Tax=Hermanssonia centrifuga TaxID=98765 RepID=A0A4S4KVD6_9APHY|nr:hypothetical protein EW026_g246 [Hermanssonia centrifuga]
MLILKCQNLKDANGDIVWEAKWYKIMLSDGTELGFGPQVNGRWSCGPRPSGQGVVVRYIRDQKNVTATNHGWPTGDVGYFKAIGMGADGKEHRKYLSLSASDPAVLAWYDTANAYGLIGEQIPGPENRIALFAKNQFDEKAGLRGDTGSLTNNAPAFFGHRSDFPVGLDCSLVPVPLGNATLGAFF